MNTVIPLFRRLQNISDISVVKTELETFSGEESKFFKTLVDNLGDDIGKYKYCFDLVSKINREDPNMSFSDIYFKYLSTKNFERYRNFYCFLSKVISEVTPETTEKDLIFSDDKDEKDVYNTVISSLELPLAIQLCRDFLSQRALNFEEYYYQVYLSAADKLKNAIDNTYCDANLLYYRNPWFENYICVKIYIASTDHDIDLFIEEEDQQKKQSPIVFRSLTWYKPNKSFYTYLSNQNNTRSLRINENDNLCSIDFYDDNKKVQFSFHILYKLLSKDLTFTYRLLNEQIYNLERKFFVLDYNECFNEYCVNIFLDDVKMFSQSNIELLFEFFNKSMKNIHSQYKINSTILKYPCMKHVRTLRDLATMIANITVFLYLDSISESIFKKRVIRNYYKLEALFSLTDKEKFPELNYDLENREVGLDFVKRSVSCEVFNIGESVYRLSNKSMFKALPKQKVHHKPFKMKYINEMDNHNYIYYNKKETWLNLKDVLTKNFDREDEYITDIIYPRLIEIYDTERVLKTKITEDDFKKKFSLVFSLLEDVLSQEEILENHRNIFFYHPDPEYEFEEKRDEEERKEEEEGDKKEEEKDGEEKTDTIAVQSIKEEKKDVVDDDDDEITDKVEDEKDVIPLKSILKEDDNDVDDGLHDAMKALIEEEEENQKTSDFDLKTFDTTDGAKKKKREKPQSCYKCNDTTDLSVKTFQHSKQNIKETRWICVCYDCLEKHMLEDY